MIVNISGDDVNLIEFETQVLSTDGAQSLHLEVWQSTSKFLSVFNGLILPYSDGFSGLAYEPDAGLFCISYNDGEDVVCKDSVAFSPALSWINEHITEIKQYAIDLRVKELDGTRGNE